MHYDRDGLELVDGNDKYARRVLKRYTSEKLYGVDYETPKYVLPIFFAGCFGFVMVFFGAIFLLALATSVDVATIMIVVGVVIATPQIIYWELTSVNESRLEKLIQDGRITYTNK